MDKLTSGEKLKICQKKYYENNKEKCNQARNKRNYVKDFGKEYVDKLYEKYNGDMSQIKPIIKIRRAYMTLKNTGIDLNDDSDTQFL